MPDETTGMRAYDLAGVCPLLPPLSQFWHAPTAAQAAIARHQERERKERIRQAGEAAVDDWTEFYSLHANDPLAAVVLDIHMPVVEWDRLVCQECRESDLDDTVGVEWPCATYAAMKAAADG